MRVDTSHARPVIQLLSERILGHVCDQACQAWQAALQPETVLKSAALAAPAIVVPGLRLGGSRSCSGCGTGRHHELCSGGAAAAAVAEHLVQLSWHVYPC